MKILVLNRGSSSIKCYVYEIQNTHQGPLEPEWEAELKWKNTFDHPSLTIGKKRVEKLEAKTANEALKHLLSSIKGKKIDVVGHRIVQGGLYFSSSVIITPQVKDRIRELAELAPLHNLPELEGIEIAEELFKNIPQVAVFDTAFHHSLPEAAKIFPGPYSWYEKGIQRFGFHGISYQYCSTQAAKILNRDLHELKMVICHLGSGASLCAIENGKSIDTTMGFTPLDGLMMDTRSGSIDPGILLYLLEMKKRSPEALSHELYYQSGLLGISGSSSDMRDIIDKSTLGDKRASLAFEIYLHRLNALIGSMVASLKGLDVLIFTAGIGENAPKLRGRVCENFSYLGVKLDAEKNKQVSSTDRELSLPDSKVKVLLVHTQEAFEIASECSLLIQ